jgi:hypothetical protein
VSAPTTPPGRTGTDWLELLLPVRIDPSLRLPDPTRIEYLRLHWTECGEEAVTLRGTRVERSDPGETLVRGEAVDADGTVVAGLDLATGHGAATRRGDATVPPWPPIRAGTVTRRRIVRAEHVEAYRSDVVGADPAIPERAARRDVLPLPVVPATMLVEVALGAALGRASGDVEAWFGDPVPVGALLEVHEHDGEPVVLHVAGREHPAVVFAQR